MKHVGDITKLDGTKLEPVWCIVGGSPCQDLSVAGKRKGLAGERSGLFMEQIRIIKEMRSIERTVVGTDMLVRLPRFAVWENVFGAYSSNNGYDFLAVLEEFAHIAEPESVIPRPEERNGKLRWEKAGVVVGDGWSVAWHTHDAQYWGVPQRRRRISVVADFGGQCAPEILFERKSVSRYSEQSEQTREETTGTVRDGTSEHDRVLASGGGRVPYTLKVRGGKPGGGKGPLIQTDKSATLSTLQDQTLFQPVLMTMQAIGQYKECGVSSSCKTRDYKDAADLVCMPTLEPVLLESNQNHAVITENGICTTLPASMGMGGGYVPMITEPKAVSFDCRNGAVNPVAETLQARTGRTLNAGGVIGQPVFCLQGNGIDRADTAGCNGAGWKEGTSYTLNTIDRPAVAFEAVCAGFSPRQGAKANGIGWQEECSPTLRSVLCGFPSPAVVYDSKVVFDARGNGEGNISPTITGDHENRVTDYTAVCVEKLIRWIVRRLTPLECERLQGFPDGWTNIGDWTDSKGKMRKASDTPRYKALGNSIALPFWKWMFRNMAKYLPEGATLGSLFDGIGGFPLCWEEIHGKGTARWASEIEEFPIAVTKERFKEGHSPI